MKIWIKDHRYLKVKEMIKQINIKLIGHYQYYGITDNAYSINLFKRCVIILRGTVCGKNARTGLKGAQFSNACVYLA